jgi:hypothetical protein
VSRLPSPPRLIALAVVCYLCFAGWFFILAPWSGFWRGLVEPNAPWWMMAAAKSAAVRGALSGFGVLHFPVAAAWLAEGRRP